MLKGLPDVYKRQGFRRVEMKKIITLLVSLIMVLNTTVAWAQAGQSLSYAVQAGFYKNKAILDHNFSLLSQRGFPVYKLSLIHI